MLNDQPNTPAGEIPGEARPQSSGGSYSNPHSVSSVNVNESVGVLFLGILSLILTVNLLRTLARNRELEVRLARLERG